MKESNEKKTKKSKSEIFFDAWLYLNRHEYFADHNYVDDEGKYPYSMFENHLLIMPVKVNPLTIRISNHSFLNTSVRVWLETGPQWQDDKGHWWNNCHDTVLDCGGKTFEDAVIALARLVEENYPVRVWGWIHDDEESMNRYELSFMRKQH